jgi:hypothetical protein
MTSEVMEVMTWRDHRKGMKKIIPVLVLLAFSVLSVELAIAGASEGINAFKSPWAMQVAIDLCIACWFSAMWMRQDARKRGISAMPFLIALPFLGSIATLAYVVRRNYFTSASSALTYAKSAI